MSLGSQILGPLLGTWFMSFIGLVALALLVWFLGPSLPFLESTTARIVVIAAIFVIWLATNLVIVYRRRQSQKKLVSGIAGAPADSASLARQSASDEVALLRERLEDALKQLRGTNRQKPWAKSYLYELPWYMLIGPPGSGKTTALRNSGLNFPLSEKFGRDPVRGVGGTRNCDWWLTDEAVMLDTAGRYTTQDSDQSVDQQAWLGFLDLLKRSRPRQPINGAVVAIGLPELAAAGPAGREAHARAIRTRLKELRERFGMRFPVYLVFAKLDLIAGFVEFFDDFDKSAREQVWGMTFPLETKDDQAAGAVAHFAPEFDALIERLNQRIVDRLAGERDVERRALIFGFPGQLASLKPMLAEFLGGVFAPSRYEERAMLRGVYFTSATQEGTPVDRLMSAIAQSFAIERQQLRAFSGAGRSYFVTRLFKELIFGEADLVQSDPAKERRRRLRRGLAYGAIAVVMVAVLAVWAMSYLGNRGLIARSEIATAQYDRAAHALDQRIVNDDNLASVMPVLDMARALPAGYDDSRQAAPLRLDFGLYQGAKLGSEAKVAYQRALNGFLLPRLMVGIHNRLAANLDNLDLSMVLLETYLMLGQEGPLNRDLVKRTVNAIWGNPYPGRDGAAGQAALDAHLDALLAEPLDRIPLDAVVVGQARDAVSRMPLPERAYREILNSPQIVALPTWRVIDHAGPAADQVLTRASGKPLTDGVPGFFTRDGFRELQQMAPEAVKAEAAQTWVLGAKYAVTATGDRLQPLIDGTLDVYLKDYIRQWDALLGDIRLVRLGSTNATIDVLNTLSGPASPLKQLMVAAAAETTLVAPPPPANNAAAPGNQALSKLSQASAASYAPERIRQVDDHFRALHELVAGAGNGQSQLDEVMKRLGDLYAALQYQAANPGTIARPGGGPSGSAAAGQLAAMAARLPPPLNGIVATASGSGAKGTVANTRKGIEDLYLTSVAPFCRQALQGRYPFDRSSSIDVSLTDFGNLFRPGGTIDAFFNNNLRPYIDTARRPWRNQKVDNVDLGLSRGVLADFARAQDIRDAFFPTGGQLPSAAFSVAPIALSGNASEVILDIDGQTLTHDKGPPVPINLAWPAPANAERARVTIKSADGKSTPSLATDGPWAVFRLLDRGQVTGQLSDQFNVTFDLDNMSAGFAWRAGSVRNPFRMGDLSRFRCPDAL
ncbi:MAG TPA: type VI secretion system membrane subunit TssM [Stellaceae bacterium]|nr:type VI secretion system membrane subunit TssM [Stellaceae bacterium]